jgi:hypothetical protein
MHAVATTHMAATMLPDSTEQQQPTCRHWLCLRLHHPFQNSRNSHARQHCCHMPANINLAAATTNTTG